MDAEEVKAATDEALAERAAVLLKVGPVMSAELDLIAGELCRRGRIELFRRAAQDAAARLREGLEFRDVDRRVA